MTCRAVYSRHRISFIIKGSWRRFTSSLIPLLAHIQLNNLCMIMTMERYEFNPSCLSDDECTVQWARAQICFTVGLKCHFLFGMTLSVIHHCLSSETFIFFALIYKNAIGLLLLMSITHLLSKHTYSRLSLDTVVSSPSHPLSYHLHVFRTLCRQDKSTRVMSKFELNSDTLTIWNCVWVCVMILPNKAM